jgi:hypothetical protein
MPKRTLFLAFLTIIVTSCGSTDPLSDVRVVASVDRSSIPSSDSARISLSVTNGSDRTVKAIAPTSYGICFHAFRVFSNSGREVAIPTGFCIAAAPQNLVAPQPIDLVPGATVTVVDYWHPAASTLDGVSLPPGIYRMLGIYHVEGRTLVSTAIQVTVEPPTP